jgi:hypothetical protein
MDLHTINARIFTVSIFPDGLRRRAVKKAGEDACGKPGLEGRYANHVKIGVNESEVILDFGQYYPEEDQPKYHTRIILAPLYAEALLETLIGALAQFEKMSQGPGREQ